MDLQTLLQDASPQAVAMLVKAFNSTIKHRIIFINNSNRKNSNSSSAGSEIGFSETTCIPVYMMNEGEEDAGAGDWQMAQMYDQMQQYVNVIVQPLNVKIRDLEAQLSESSKVSDWSDRSNSGAQGASALCECSFH